MKHLNKKLSIRICSALLSLIMLFISSFPSYAEKSGSTDTSKYQSELSNLTNELAALEKDLDEILLQTKQTSKRLEETKKSLAIAMGNEQAQYESMMLRIKYMYENSSLGTLELLFSSSCFAEFVSRAEYVLQVAEYDRKLLKELEETRKEIEAQQAQLLEDQKYLEELGKTFAKKEKELKSKIASTSKDLSSYLAKLEETKNELNQATSSSKEEIKPVTPSTGNTGSASNSGSNTNTSTSTQTGAVSYTSDDVTLLAALIECEAGSTNYEGMLAVGSVVVNRMKHYKFPNTLSGVVYHAGQFPPAHDGKVDRVLARGVKSSCVKAATDALNGKNNVGSCLYFRSASSGRQGLIIGGNVFF